MSSSIVFRKPDFLSKKLKNLTNPNFYRVQYFFTETSHRFSTNCLQKDVWLCFIMFTF